MREKADHIALTLTTGVEDTCVGSAAGDTGIGSIHTTRKSIRRTWNQLPRCQRNLIILGVSAVCLTLLLLLPGEYVDVRKPNASPVRRDKVNVLPSGRTGARSTHPLSGGQSNVGDDVDANGLERNIFPAPAPHHQEKGQQQQRQQQHVESVVNLPETQQGQDDDAAVVTLSDEKLNQKINIQELDINDNNIETPNESQDQDGNDVGSEADVKVGADQVLIEATIQQPNSLPGMNGATIEELLRRIDEPSLPRKQHFHGARNERQDAVVAAFKHSWAGYKKYAWGHDNLKPISQTSHDWFGLGLTIVDSLDTIYIMGLEEEFAEARDWVNEFLTFDINRDVNLFEVSIRVLGGLLSAYHLSADKVFLKKSLELGNRLLPCFLSPSGIPYSDVNLAAMSAHAPKWSPDSSTSEVTTIQLEFRDLSRLTNVSLYERIVHRVNEKVHSLEKNNGLVPIFINANTGTFRNYATISLGARGDSYYEYLLKQWLQTGRKKDDFLVTDYIRAIDGVLTKLLRRTPREGHVFIGELINGKEFKPKMDHLTCYLPGTLLLGHHFGMPDSHLLLARDLLETCYQTYMRQPTQLAPEISYFAVGEHEELDIYVKPNDAHNLLRPEFIESLYYFYALSGNHTYQNMGWTIFQAFEKHTKVANGYTSIGNVKNVFNTRLRDMMESFWLGETLKYFYLLFSDNPKEFDLEKWVFNTEAHPLPMWKN